MDVTKMIGAALAIGSVLLGGALGATALEKANSAPLNRSASAASPRESVLAVGEIRARRVAQAPLGG